MNFLDIYDELSKKRKLTKMDKCRYLASLPDVTMMSGCEPNAEAVEKFYTKDDIDDLFDYWYGYCKAFRRKDPYLWQ